MSRFLISGARFDLRQLSEESTPKQNGTSAQAKTSPTTQSNGQEVRRRNKNNNDTITNHTSVKPQANGDSNRSQGNAEKRNSQNSTKQLSQTGTVEILLYWLESVEIHHHLVNSIWLHLVNICPRFIDEFFLSFFISIFRFDYGYRIALFN